MIGVGIIGAGSIAQAHANAYAKEHRVRLLAFADVDPSAAERAAARFGAKAVEVDALFEDARIQAVSICTPPASHADLAVRALEAGKHVLIEKPVAASYNEAMAIAAAAGKGRGLKAMVAHSHRFWPTNRKAKELLDAGVIGRIVMVRDEILSHERVGDGPLPWRFRRSIAGGGVVMDNGVHALDRLRYWLNREAAALDARVWHLVPGADVEDAAVINVHFEALPGEETGPSAQVYLNRCAPKSGGRCVAEFLGTRGMLKVETWGEVTWCEGEGPWRTEPVDNSLNAFDLEIRSFVSCILEDREVPVTVADAAVSLRLVEKAYESALRGERVRVVP